MDQDQANKHYDFIMAYFMENNIDLNLGAHIGANIVLNGVLNVGREKGMAFLKGMMNTCSSIFDAQEADAKAADLLPVEDTPKNIEPEAQGQEDVPQVTQPDVQEDVPQVTQPDVQEDVPQ